MGALTCCAAATRRTMPAKVLSEGGRVTSRSNVVPRLTDPLSTASPERRWTGTDSPVNVLWSSTAEPEITVPSAGATSPPRTRMRSPGTMVSSGTSSRLPPICRNAVFGTRLSSAVISRRARPSAIALQELAARVHQRHDDAGQRFAEGNRPRHRKRRDQVEPDAAMAEVGDNLHQQCRKHREDGGAPDPVWQARAIQQGGRKSEREPAPGKCQERYAPAG